jgi:hypothetical protein
MGGGRDATSGPQALLSKPRSGYSAPGATAEADHTSAGVGCPGPWQPRATHT